MANRAYLFNTDRPVANPFMLREEGAEVHGPFDEVADWARSIPIPWMLAFRPEDARPFTHVWVEDPDDPESERQEFRAHAFCVTRERALENLRASLPVFEQVVGDARLAGAYLRDAVAAFGSLERPYVVLHADELIDGDDARFLAALGGSVEMLRLWGAYTPGRALEDDEAVPDDRDEDGLSCGFGR
jgi:hypothetical protein